MRLFIVTALLAFSMILLLPGCSSVEYPPDQAPRMLVASETTPFYLHGPAQGFGADRMLIRGEEVQVLRKEFGYSFVQLHNGQFHNCLVGYVANQALVIAPPLPRPKPHRVTKHSFTPSDTGTFFPQPEFRY